MVIRVKSHKRKTKSGKITIVRPYLRHGTKKETFKTKKYKLKKLGSNMVDSSKKYVVFDRGQLGIEPMDLLKLSEKERKAILNMFPTAKFEGSELGIYTGHAGKDFKIISMSPETMHVVFYDPKNDFYNSGGFTEVVDYKDWKKIIKFYHKLMEKNVKKIGKEKLKRFEKISKKYW